MKEGYEGFVGVYEVDGLEERLAYIQNGVENVCEILERILECFAEEREKELKKGDEFRLGKIGADIGEEMVQEDVIAKIFGNRG